MNKAILSSVLLSILCAGGCTGRMIKEALGTVRGPRGVWAPVQEAPGVAPLASYQRFELDIHDSFGKTPVQLLTQLPLSFREELESKNLPNSQTGKTLVVRGSIIHYEAEGMKGLAFGDFEEVVTRLQLVDKDSGKVLAEANCIGRSTESVNRGIKNKADGLAKAIAGWIASGYTVKE